MKKDIRIIYVGILIATNIVLLCSYILFLSKLVQPNTTRDNDEYTTLGFILLVLFGGICLWFNYLLIKTNSLHRKITIKRLSFIYLISLFLALIFPQVFAFFESGEKINNLEIRADYRAEEGNWKQALDTYSFIAPRVNHSNQNILKMQTLLNQYGYYDKPLNGKYNKSILSNFKRLQRTNGLIADGILGKKTQQVLDSIAFNDPKLHNFLDSAKLQKQQESKEFVFLGEKIGRKDNFDTPIVVTNDNIEKLYRNYYVSKLLEEENTVYYLITSKRIYVGARYLTRVVKIVDNQQTQAINFYDSRLFYFEKMGDNFLVGINSVQYFESAYDVCHCCEIIIFNQNFDKIFERKFKYEDRRTTRIWSLIQTKEGFNAEIINAWFEDGEEDAILYKASFDKNGNMLNSSQGIVNMTTFGKW